MGVNDPATHLPRAARRPLKWAVVSLFYLVAGPATAQDSRRVDVAALLRHHGVSIAPVHSQLLLVTAPTWRSSRAALQRLVRDRDGRWQPVGKPLAARIGANGFGRGRGLWAPRSGPEKEEGDRRSPAGVFELGTAFGTLKWSKEKRGPWPWRDVDSLDRWVDDPSSKHYNRWRRLPRAGARGAWRSAEKLAVYRVGIVIEHNRAPVKPSAGSAIFLHDGNLSEPSVGCTMLSLRDMQRVLRWLRAEAKPLIVQLPLTSR